MKDYAGFGENLSGRLAAGGHVLLVRVYYEDTDAAGIVYHANYLRFLERGRTDFLRLLGVTHADLAAGRFGEKLGFVAHRVAIDFLRPARLDDLLQVTTRLSEAGGARVVLSQTVSREDDTIARAEVTIAVIDHSGRARRIPPALRARLLAR